MFELNGKPIKFESSTMYKNVKNLTLNNDMFLNRLKFYSKNSIKTSFKNILINIEEVL